MLNYNQPQLTVITSTTHTHSKLKSLWRSLVYILAISSLSQLSFATTDKPITATILTPPISAWKKHTVKQGDSLSSIFKRLGLTDNDVMNISESAATQNVFNKLMPNEQLLLLIKDNKLSQIRYYKKTNNVFVISSDPNSSNYIIDTITPAADTKVVRLPSTKQAISTVKNDALAKAHLIIDKGPTELIITPSVEPLTEPPAKIQASLIDVLNSAKNVSNQNRTDNWVYYTVAANDNLSSIFIKAGLSHSDVYYIGNASNSEQSFKNLQIGEKIAFLIRSGHLIKVNYIISKMKNILYTRLDKTNYRINVFEKKPVTEIKQVAGSIKNSFFVDALSAGLSNNVAMNFTTIFGWDIDFSQDVQPGDSFKVAYEELTIDGTKIKNGNIIAAQFTTGNQRLVGIFFKNSEGEAGFYSPDGRSMHKAFLRMPVELARISSKFNLRRKHPIYNKIRAHKGVDYAAKRGTPIMASGNGKIIFRGRKGDFGNTIIIQHGGNIDTLYAHMSGFNKAFKTGSRVTQGQVIGYVGATGAVTGAHLHYEFRVNKVHKNPLTVKLTQPIGLNTKDLAAFKLVAKQAMDNLNFNSDEKIALNQTKKKL
ncbi:MAG: peptidoglycan DD-metalloendopeptidase family protein [Oceanospirillaceae bacterium]